MNQNESVATKKKKTTIATKDMVVCVQDGDTDLKIDIDVLTSLYE